MGKLDGAVGYLAGPIEFAADDGVSWRENFKQACKDMGLNLTFIDPTNKPTGGIKEIGVEKHRFQQLLREERYDELTAPSRRQRRREQGRIESWGYLTKRRGI